MAKKFRGLEVACIPFPGCLASQAETHFPLHMDLPVLDQGHLLAKAKLVTSLSVGAHIQIPEFHWNQLEKVKMIFKLVERVMLLF